MPMDFRTGPVSGRDNYRFTCGDCHILASRIHRLTGWPMATFMWGDDPIDHAFVICPDGDALDIQGKTPLDQFCERWGHPTESVKTWTGRQLWKTCWYPGPHFGHYSYVRARQLAVTILESLGHAS